MKRSVLSILVQTAYRTSLTLLDNFTARADYLKCLVWLQASAALSDDPRFTYYKQGKVVGREHFDWDFAAGQTAYPPIVSAFGGRPGGKSVFAKAAMRDSVLMGHCAMEHAQQMDKNANGFDGRAVFFVDEAMHPSKEALDRCVERMRTMRILKDNPLNAKEFDRLFHGGVAVTTDTGVKWEDYDAEKTLEAIHELRELDPQTDLERRRQAFLDGLWEPGFKDAYEQEMVKKGGH